MALEICPLCYSSNVSGTYYVQNCAGIINGSMDIIAGAPQELITKSLSSNSPLNYVYSNRRTVKIFASMLHHLCCSMLHSVTNIKYGDQSHNGLCMP